MMAAGRGRDRACMGSGGPTRHLRRRWKYRRRSTQKQTNTGGRCSRQSQLMPAKMNTVPSHCNHFDSSTLSTASPSVRVTSPRSRLTLGVRRNHVDGIPSISPRKKQGRLCLSQGTTVEKSATIRKTDLHVRNQLLRRPSPQGWVKGASVWVYAVRPRAVDPSESLSGLCPAGREDRAAGLGPWVLVSQLLTRRKGRKRRDDYSFRGHAFERLWCQVLLN